MMYIVQRCIDSRDRCYLSQASAFTLDAAGFVYLAAVRTYPRDAA